MKFQNRPSWLIVLVVILTEVQAADDDYNVIHRDGSYEFGYNNPDSYHYANANRNNVVKGEFGGRNPGTGAIDSVVYTAGPRGFRPRGKNVVRKYDLNQSGPRPVGSRDDPYYDPFEDPSYSFSFVTGKYNRHENANRLGDVTGGYSYTDDVGERHNVEFIAGKNTGFHVKTPFPDSNPRAYGPLFFNGRGKPIPRGRTSIQRGLDGSYRFVSAGPDQRRTETSDSTGHVRGSYTYLDDKGIQHSVHYIAGPETGYRVLKQVKGPHLPTIFPFSRPEIIPPDFYDPGKDSDLFDTAASGHIKPSGGKPRPTTVPAFPADKNKNKDEFTFGSKPVESSQPSGSFGRPNEPPFADDSDDDFENLFGEGPTGGTSSGGGGGGPAGSTTAKPSSSGSGQELPKPGLLPTKDDGSYKPSGEDGSYRPSVADSKPTSNYGSDTLPRPGGLGIDSASPTQGISRPGSSGRPGGRPDGRPGGRPGGSPGGSLGGSPGEGSGGRPGGRPSGRPSGSSPDGSGYNTGYGSEKPSPGFNEYGSNEVSGDFGLFGSESNNARPPYGSKPVIQVGHINECEKCKGTIFTNVGDKLFTVPPGVSVRAHVQAIDLLPISPTVPSPSEQYKADVSLKTEQLNEVVSEVVSANNTDSTSEKTTTEATITTTLIPNTNSTDT